MFSFNRISFDYPANNLITKDFLFLTYSFVAGAKTCFNYILNKGHTGDIANEDTYLSFIRNNKVKYKNIVVYLHEKHQLIQINNYINSNPNSFLIQHDDTDFEQIQKWTNREPQLYMRREHTSNTKITTSSPVYPIHFAMESIYKENSEKIYDVCFIGTPTHPRRAEFVKKLESLANGELSYLKFYINASPYPGWVPGDASKEFRDVVNKSKIGIHYFGNSYDSTRIWETLSCNTALLMPENKVKIPEQPLEKGCYEILADDFSDLKERIEFLLMNDNWKNIASKGQENYNKYHTQEKCCEYYYSKIIKHCKI
jgi:hypothetical protein